MMNWSRNLIQLGQKKQTLEKKIADVDEKILDTSKSQ